MHGPFEYIEGYTKHGSPQRVRLSLAELLSNYLGRGQLKMVTEAGCLIEKDWSERVHIYVNWPDAIKGPLQGSTFTYKSSKKLAQLARTVPEFSGQEKRYFHKRQKR